MDDLKIDGSFVRNFVNGPVDRAMADTIHRVGHITGLQTVGEFVESTEVIARHGVGADGQLPSPYSAFSDLCILPDLPWRSAGWGHPSE